MDKDYLLEKWLNDDMSGAEKQAFSQLDDAEFNQYIIDNAKYFKASHFSDIADFDTFKKRYNSQNTPVKKLNWMNPFIKIASVVVISLGLYFTFFNNTETLVETLAGEKTTIELPDASIVELNALSSITYNADDWVNNRALKLNGEAYFKVAKGKTFDVKTKAGIVTVVGTQFNVKQRHNYFEVKCFEGIVLVSSDTITRQLLAGDTYQILNGKFQQGKTINLVPKWTDNLSDFEAIPFNEVLSELERQYNIEITTKNIDANRLFTGAFTHTNLENALISITQPMNMTYELSSSNLVTINGRKN
jgi:transmembrane sensor